MPGALAKTSTRPRCKNCKRQFTPKFNTLQPCCGVNCAYAWAQGKSKRDLEKAKKASKKQRIKDKREFRENDRALQTKLCQQAVNWHVKYVLYPKKECYTCGTNLTNAKQIDAGHWLSVGAHPDKRFDTRFIRPQCVRCNRYNSGESGEFEKRLREELGDELVDEFVASKPPKLTRPEIVELKKKYLRLNRQAKKAMDND